MNKLFFELIQVSLGTRISLSHTPSADEWGELYTMAKKQSLIGICFAGAQRLSGTEDSINHTPYTINLQEVLYLQWMGMAAKIQQRNEVVNQQCVELQEKLSADGLRSSILKGQGVGQLYAEHLRGLRQSGDIDVFVAGGMEKVLRYCTETFGKVEWDYINAHAPFYDNTEVEMHWRAQAMTNLCANRRLQRWLEMPETQMMVLGGKAMLANGQVLVVPTAEFNAFYILLHCYHHMFESGLGLRQLMDYYWTLSNSPLKGENLKRSDAANNIKRFGMMRFAKGIMWIMQEVFKLERECMVCEPDEKEGKFLLKEVMQNGNFGHHDERVKKVGSGKMSELWRNVQHNWHLASHYPSEFFWQPVWLVYHFFWKRMN